MSMKHERDVVEILGLGTVHEDNGIGIVLVLADVN